MQEAKVDGRLCSFDDLLAIVKERELDGGAIFVVPSKGGRRKKKTTLISAGALSGLRCCGCGRHFFRGGHAGEHEKVVVLHDEGAKALSPLCGFCAGQEEDERQKLTANADLEVSEEGQTTTETDEHSEVVVVGATAVVTSELTSSSTRPIISGAGARDIDLPSGHGKSNENSGAGKCLKRVRVSGPTAIRRNCGRRGVRR